MNLHLPSPSVRQKNSARRMALSVRQHLTMIRGSAILCVAKRYEKGFRDTVSGAFFFCALTLSFFATLFVFVIEPFKALDDEAAELDTTLCLEGQ